MKKHLLSFLLIFFSASVLGFAANIGDKYQRITSIGDIESGAEYILCKDSNVLTSMGSNSYIPTIAAGINLNNDIAEIVKEEVEAFVIESYNSNYAFKFGDQYLYCNAGTESTNNNNKLELRGIANMSEVSIEFDKDNTVLITFVNVTNPSKLLKFNSNRFSNYASNSGGSNGQLYKKISDNSNGADEKKYSIIFGNTSVKGATDINPDDLDNFILQGSEYVRSASKDGYVANESESERHIRLASGSNPGQLVLTLSNELQKANIYKIEVDAAPYSGSKTFSFNGVSKTISERGIYEYNVTSPLDILTISATKGNQTRIYSITLFESEENFQELGAIVASVNGEDKTQEIAENYSYTANLNDVFTFSADNADDIKIFVKGKEVGDTFADNKKTWTLNELYKEEYISVVPYQNGNAGGDDTKLYFNLTVTPSKPSTPVVKIGDEVLENEGNKIVPTNTVLTITSENATSITGMYVFEDDSDEAVNLTGNQPFTYTVTKSGILLIDGLNDAGSSDESFMYEFTVGEPDPNMPKVGSRFKQVKSLEELVEGEYYVIANNTKAMSKEPYTNRTTGMASTDNYEYTPQINTGSQSFSTVTITGNDVLIVKLEKQGDDWGIKTVNYGTGFDVEQGYLSNPESTFLSVDASGEFIASDISITSVYNTDIKLNGNTVKLASSGNYFNMSSGNAIQLYRYTKAQKYEYEGVFSDIALRVAEEAYSYVPSVEGKHPNFIYSVPNNQNRITVEDNALVVNPKATYGDVKVTVSWEESDEWFGGSTSFVVSILEPIIESNMDFRYSIIYGKLGVGVATQAVYYDGDGAVTYYITDHEGNDVSNEIRINPETGMIRPEDLVSPVVEKIYVVTAKALETVNYTACEASYIIIIHAPDYATPDISGATFDFVNNGYGMFEGFKSSNTGGTSNSLQNYFENNINEKYTHTPVSEFVESPVSIKMTGNYRWILYDAETNGDNKMQFRMHKGATMTFSVPSGQGYAIRSIKFNGNSKATSQYLTTELGSWSDDQTTWLAPDVKTTTVEFKDPTGNNGETIWIYTIVVDLIAPPVNQFDEVGLSFDNSPEEVEHYINTFVGDITQLPKLKHHENLDFNDVVFGIDEFSDNKGDDNYLDYTIQNVDFENLSVIINEPGIYTFRAEYDPDREENVGTDKFLKGMAILRLNVFPRLDVVPHPESDNALADDARTQNPELTLVHSTTNEAGVESATIQLPTLANLGDDLKYSTVKVNKVVVKHGADVTVYKDMSQDAPAASKRARIAAASDEEDEANATEVKDITEVPESFEFSQDGYVKYSIVYANTPDFSIEEKVHVVLMPAVTAQAQQEDKSLTLTPLNGSTLQYYIYWFDNTFPEYPGSTASDGQEDAAMSILAASTEMNTWNTSTESVTVQRPNDADENEDVLYAVRYRAAKDIEDVVTQIESIDNSQNMLYSDYVATGISSSGTTTGVEGIVVDRDDNDAPAVYYNLQGVRMDGRRLAPGVYICVKGSTSTKVLVGK